MQSLNIKISALLIICFFSLALSCGCPRRADLAHQADSLTPNISSSIPVSGSYHNVVKDENLSRIAKNYGTTVRLLAELNNLKPPYLIKEGMRIFIPGNGSETPPEKKESVEQEVESPEEDKSKLSWPVKGLLVSEFGVREGALHNGITIKAQEGTKVLAAENGKIGYVGSIPGYGKVILIEHFDHPQKLVTVYAHLKETLTVKGKVVKRKEAIGTVGNSGRANHPSLYFEVRTNSKPRNPLFFLTRTDEH